MKDCEDCINYSRTMEECNKKHKIYFKGSKKHSLPYNDEAMWKGEECEDWLYNTNLADFWGFE